MAKQSLVERARSAAGFGTKYKLGKGGFNPASPHPWSSLGECDCSGFIAWVLGISRHTDNPWYRKQNGGWLETTAIVRDCGTPFGFFDKREWTQARPGDLIVYGDSGGKQGHVGLITEVDATGPVKAIHCSSGNSRGGDAIRETGVDIWKKRGGIVAAHVFV